MVGFKATGKVTKDDFDNVVIPAVDKSVAANGVLNYLLVLDTEVSNFEGGAWLKDVFLGIKNLTKWNRAAIVSDSTGVKIFTEVFSVVTPGEFKGFKMDQLEEAIGWVSEKGVSENVFNKSQS